jgi:hypothetical protein
MYFLVRDLFLIYFNFGILNKTSTCVRDISFGLTYIYKHHLFKVDHAVKYCITISISIAQIIYMWI